MLFILNILKVFHKSPFIHPFLPPSSAIFVYVYDVTLLSPNREFEYEFDLYCKQTFFVRLANRLVVSFTHLIVLIENP